MPYFNYLGQAMPESASPTNNIYGSSSGNETLTAPAGPSSVDGQGGINDVFIGSSGDNIFYLKNPTETVQVASGLPGVKTVVAFTSFALPDNVQNLTSAGSFNYAEGNKLDNLIILGNDPETIYGGGGNDVLVGGGASDLFIIKAGEGNDVIYNWNAADQVQLGGTAFKSFSDVQAAMVQVGPDVKLQLDPSEVLIFRNTTPASFAAGQLLLPLDRSKLGAMTFDDEFNSLNLYNFSTGQGQWQASFGFDPHNQNNYALVYNGEQEAYVTPSFQGTSTAPLGLNPFNVSNGTLTITAAPMPQADQQLAYGQSYSSGLLDTRGIFEQKYGYFEIRMALPVTATGAWPAFWMAPDPNLSGIEADITEDLAIQPNINFVRGFSGNGQAAAFADVLKPGDITGFHTYGMMWTPQTITFYYDDQAVYQAPTPSTWTDPMYLITNLAVAGFGGNPDPSKFPASMQIDYIHAYGLADGSSTVEHLTPLAPGGTLQLNGGVIAGEPAIVAQTFADDGTATTTRHVAQISTDPQHATAAELAAAGTKALVMWDNSGAVDIAYKNGSTYSGTAALMAGSIEAQHITGAFLSDGHAVVTWVETDNGVQNAWAAIVDTSQATPTFTRQELGPSSGGPVTIVATAHGGFAASWSNGGQIEGRGYDGYTYFGDMVPLQGALAGQDASGHVVASWSGGSGQQSQLYNLLTDPFAVHGTASAQTVQSLDTSFQDMMREPATNPNDVNMISQLGGQVDSGAITMAAAVAALAHADAGATSSVAILTYQFFTGSAPTATGMDYLVSPSGPNPNNLNAAYYQAFSLENRYINFAVNLGKLGAGEAVFSQTYGAESLTQATSDAYAKIFGTTPTAAKVSAILDASVTSGGMTMTRADYFALYGGDGASGLGTKAAMVGWLLAEAVTADVGTFALSNDAFLKDVGLNNAPFGVDIIGHYNQAGFAYTGG